MLAILAMERAAIGAAGAGAVGAASCTSVGGALCPASGEQPASKAATAMAMAARPAGLALNKPKEGEQEDMGDSVSRASLLAMSAQSLWACRMGSRLYKNEHIPRLLAKKPGWPPSYVFMQMTHQPSSFAIPVALFAYKMAADF
ncbi:MAG: hypothetical protein LBE58_05540 [Comamonas sp.]|jgi:hypothetical protein|nr:hypothetical protein [Comamonas sp.]